MEIHDSTIKSARAFSTSRQEKDGLIRDRIRTTGDEKLAVAGLLGLAVKGLDIMQAGQAGASKWEGVVCQALKTLASWTRESPFGYHVWFILIVSLGGSFGRSHTRNISILHSSTSSANLLNTDSRRGHHSNTRRERDQRSGGKVTGIEHPRRGQRAGSVRVRNKGDQG